jgi:hypothetical protein
MNEIDVAKKVIDEITTTASLIREQLKDEPNMHPASKLAIDVHLMVMKERVVRAILESSGLPVEIKNSQEKL